VPAGSVREARKNDVKAVSVEQVALLCFKPSPAGLRLALGTTPYNADLQSKDLGETSRKILGRERDAKP
jgi:hypothetical protein